MASAIPRRQAVLYLILAAALWSTSGVFIKLLTWSPLAILGGRSFVAFFVFLIYLRRIDFRFTPVQIIGALSYVGTQLFFVWATKLTTAANAIFLQYASPLYIVIFGYFLLKEKPRRADWIAMSAIFAGMFLFFGDKLSFTGFLGNFLAILSGVAMASMMLCLRKQKDSIPAETIFLGNFIGFVIGLPFMFKESFAIQNSSIILFLGIFQIGLSFILYSIAIKHIHVLEANLIVTLEPILNPVWVFLVLGEAPGRLALVGCILVIGAVTYRAIVSARAKSDDNL
jgi:drug/metabolite transporter (DMT)-like permease